MTILSEEKVAYILVGLPGTGKSTWTRNFSTEDDFIISTDDILELIGNKYRMTYNQLFDNITYSFAEKMMYKIAKHAMNSGKAIIWDQTNLTIKSRAKKIQLLREADYTISARVFHIPNDHVQRLAGRKDKIIPEHVLQSMLNKFEMPTYDEGFKSILEFNKNG